MADLLHWVYGNVVVFLLVLTVVVFVHELGHFLLARACGVKVETFSIGFGPELFGYTAKKTGTRWRVSLLPFGGYVKMLGDADAASTPGSIDNIPEAERKLTFQSKNLAQKAAIIAAGPLFNLIFGLLVAAGGFMAMGELRLAPVVGDVQPGSAAEEAGIKAGDRVISANGQAVTRFQDLQGIVLLDVDGALSLVLKRGEEQVSLVAHPRVTEVKDSFGNVSKHPILGIRSDPDAAEVIKHTPLTALAAAGHETVGMISATLTGVGQMLSGRRSTDDISGPLRIAKRAGQAAQIGFGGVVFYIFLLSINLGLINLFPVPLLDGGHLLFYGIEAVRGRPLGPKTQEYGFRLGLFLVLALMLLATSNDVIDLLHGG